MSTEKGAGGRRGNATRGRNTNKSSHRRTVLRIIVMEALVGGGKKPKTDIRCQKILKSGGGADRKK